MLDLAFIVLRNAAPSGELPCAPPSPALTSALPSAQHTLVLPLLTAAGELVGLRDSRRAALIDPLDARLALAPCCLSNIRMPRSSRTLRWIIRTAFKRISRCCSVCASFVKNSAESTCISASTEGLTILRSDWAIFPMGWSRILASEMIRAAGFPPSSQSLVHISFVLADEP